MYCYNILNDQGIVIAAVQLNQASEETGYVQVPEYSHDNLGKKYDAEASARAGGPVFAAVDVAPPPITEVTELQFRGLFTQAEKRAIYAAAAVEIDVQIWLDDLRALGGKPVVLTDPRTVDGVRALEGIGVIDHGRAAQILAATGINEV